MKRSLITKFFVLFYGVFALAGLGIIQTKAETNRASFNSLSIRAQKLRESADRLKLLSGITIGSSEENVTKAIERLFSPVQTNRYLGEYPFTEMLPYTNRDVVIEWRSKGASSSSSEEIIFGVFSDAAKTNLIDALSYRSGHVEPLVDGRYNMKLFSLRKGDTIQRVYNDLGRRECEYFQDKAGKWQVRFLYFGLGGRVIVIEADAAEGRILSVNEGTI